MNEPQVSVSASDAVGLRRRQPYNEALPSTMRWAAKLPAEVRPMALLKKYPRIANMLARSWTNAADCDTCLEDLLTDRRGHRRGFPVDVLEDLLTLENYYHGHYPQLPAREH
jgi:hypothetical protein